MLGEVFDAEGPELVVGGISVSAIARAVPPPFYVYDIEALEERYRVLDEAFSPSRVLHCVALKANAQPALLRPLAAAGAGAEVVSGAELALALEIGFTPERIVFSGVGKSDEELAAGLSAGIKMFLVESEQELQVLDALAASTSTRAPVALRLNPDIDAGTHPHIATGVSTAKFGFDPEGARTVLAARESFAALDFVGLHSHIGSQITSLDPLESNARMLATWARELRDEGVPIACVDVGGGVGISYEHDGAPDLAGYAKRVLAHFDGLDVEVVTEPGRVLFGPVGAFVAKVLYAKTVHGRKFAVVNAGLNDLLRPALYSAYHRVVPVAPRNGAPECLDIAGAVCESSDIFARERVLPPLERGDLVAILDAGAYGFVMSSNYNLRPRPAEVVVEGGRFRVARPAETVDELVARELGRRA